MFGRKAKREAEEQAKAAEKQAKNEKRFQELLTAAEAGDEASQDDLNHWRTTDPADQRRLEAIKNVVAIRRDYNYYGPETTKAHAKWQRLVGTTDEIEALGHFIWRYERVGMPENLDRLANELGIGRDAAIDLLAGLVKTRYEELVPQIGDVEKFKELWDLIRLTRGRDFTDKNGKKYSYGYEFLPDKIDRLAYPDSWNDSVALHYDTPTLRMFVRQPERGYGDVRLLADEAVRTRDFTNAQIALACCNADTKCRAAVGDVLTARLARVVNRHRARLLITEGAAIEE